MGSFGRSFITRSGGAINPLKADLGKAKVKVRSNELLSSVCMVAVDKRTG